MILRFYDFEFNLLYAEPKLIKSKWTVYYNGVGNFEAHLPLTSEAMEIVINNRYIVVVQGGFSAIVVGKELRDELIIYGRTCNWLLTKRIAPEAELVSKKAGEIATELVLSAFSDVENFILGDIADTDTIDFEYGRRAAIDVVTDCLERSGAGHSLIYDYRNKKWVFNILKGIENDIILSEANKNAYDTRLCTDIIDLATCGWYNVETEDGFVRTYLDGDTDKKGIYRWETELSGKNENEAGAELSKKSEENEVTLKTKGAKLLENYSLGDIVRVQIIKGIYRNTVKRRIIGVQTRFEQGIREEQPIFAGI